MLVPFLGYVVASTVLTAVAVLTKPVSNTATAVSTVLATT